MNLNSPSPLLPEVRVIFSCKSCENSTVIKYIHEFQNLEEFFDHKKRVHFQELNKATYIVLEEKSCENSSSPESNNNDNYFLDKDIVEFTIEDAEFDVEIISDGNGKHSEILHGGTDAEVSQLEPIPYPELMPYSEPIPHPEPISHPEPIPEIEPILAQNPSETLHDSLCSLIPVYNLINFQPAIQNPKSNPQPNPVPDLYPNSEQGVLVEHAFHAQLGLFSIYSTPENNFAHLQDHNCDLGKYSESDARSTEAPTECITVAALEAAVNTNENDSTNSTIAISSSTFLEKENNGPTENILTPAQTEVEADPEIYFTLVPDNFLCPTTNTINSNPSFYQRQRKSSGLSDLTMSSDLLLNTDTDADTDILNACNYFEQTDALTPHQNQSVTVASSSSKKGFKTSTNTSSTSKEILSVSPPVYAETTDNSVSFVCEICGLTLKTRVTLKYHVKTHLKERPFKCPHVNCTSSFKTKRELSGHQKLHEKSQFNPNSKLSKLPFIFPEPEPENPAKISIDGESDQGQVKSQGQSDPSNPILTPSVVPDLRQWLQTERHKAAEALIKADDFVNVILLDPDPADPANVTETQPLQISPENPITCKLCCTKMESATILKIHVIHCWRQNKRRHRYCIPCKKTFNRPSALGTHNLQFHLNFKTDNTTSHHALNIPKIFYCPICPKKYLDQTAFDRHLESHKPRKDQFRTFVCKICGRNYPNNCSLIKHQATHSDLRPYQCKVTVKRGTCSKAFKTKRDLLKHDATHFAFRTHRCPHDGCSKSFKTRHNLNNHLKTLAHRGINGFDDLVGNSRSRAVTCDVDGCGKVYSQRAGLDRHLIVAHGRGDRYDLPKFPCNICGRIFNWKTSLDVHIQSHTDERRFNCGILGCGKAYRRKGELIAHARKHTGERPFQCDLCGNAYARRISLRRHMAITHYGKTTRQD